MRSLSLDLSQISHLHYILMRDATQFQFKDFMIKIHPLLTRFCLNLSGLLQMSYFHENWGSVESLLWRSCRVAGLVCTIKVVAGGGGWDGRSDPSLYRVTVVKGIRNLPDTLCDAIRPNSQVHFTYSYNFYKREMSTNIAGVGWNVPCQ